MKARSSNKIPLKKKSYWFVIPWYTFHNDNDSLRQESVLQRFPSYQVVLFGILYSENVNIFRYTQVLISHQYTAVCFTRYRLMNSMSLKENYMNLCTIKKRDFFSPAQWFRVTDVEIPKNRDTPRKSGHLVALTVVHLK